MIDLSDCTFNIPIRIESEDRKKNITIVLDFIKKHLKTNVILCEQDVESKLKDIWKPEWSKFCTHMFLKDENPLFHKTKYLNAMARVSNTPYIISHDSDVLMLPIQYSNARNILKHQVFSFCYPFSEPLRNIPKDCIDELCKNYELSSVIGKTSAPHSMPPPGGCFFITKTQFIKAGMENENMIAYGPEDIERLTRIEKLGFKVGRLPGALYHIEHVKIDSSAESHQFSKSNEDEFNKIKSMTMDQLQYYVGTWE